MRHLRKRLPEKNNNTKGGLIKKDKLILSDETDKITNSRRAESWK
jgi:hypothetical protein